MLSSVVLPLPLGTNLGLLQVLWALLSGRLLAQRGALLPALQASGLNPTTVRRAWAALAYGRWQVAEMLAAWQGFAKQENRWQAARYGPYAAVAVDLVGFFRPRLKNCATKHYLAAVGKALPAIPLGMIAALGQVGPQRVPLLRALVRDDHKSRSLSHSTLRQAAHSLADDELLLADSGFTLSAMLAAGVRRFILRGPRNFSARRATPPAYGGRGRRPTRGELVRPLARRYRQHPLAATPPDRVERWLANGRHFRAEFWEQLVLPQARPGASTFTGAAIYNPDYQQPLLLLTDLLLSGPQLYAFYLERWGIEPLPLTAKQLLGAHRQFVFAAEPRQRLPELALLAASLLLYLAATQPAQATGFWDRTPRPTAGRLRRQLAQISFSDSWPLPQALGKKSSATDHLPKGVLAHRRVSSQPLRPVRSHPRRPTVYFSGN